MTKRMLLATLALAGLGVATYLSLYKLGYIGTIACGIGSCETVQASRYAMFWGLPVAVWGLGFYIALFAVSFASTLPKYDGMVGISTLMLVMTAWGTLFSGWLTYVELFVIDAICQWCVISAIIITIAFVVSWLEWREVRRSAAAG